MKLSGYLTLLGCVAVGGSCNRNSDSVAPSTCAQIDERAAIVSRTATAYSSNINQANCEAYKKAVNDYLDAASRCPQVAQADITKARNDLNTLKCQ